MCDGWLRGGGWLNWDWVLELLAISGFEVVQLVQATSCLEAFRLWVGMLPKFGAERLDFRWTAFITHNLPRYTALKHK